MSLSHRRPDTRAFHAQDPLRRAYTCAIDSSTQPRYCLFPLVTRYRCESPPFTSMSSYKLSVATTCFNILRQSTVTGLYSCGNTNPLDLHRLKPCTDWWLHVLYERISFLNSFFLLYSFCYWGGKKKNGMIVKRSHSFIQFVSPVSQRTNEKSSSYFAWSTKCVRKYTVLDVICFWCHKVRWSHSKVATNNLPCFCPPSETWKEQHLLEEVVNRGLRWILEICWHALDNSIQEHKNSQGCFLFLFFCFFLYLEIFVIVHIRDQWARLTGSVSTVNKCSYLTILNIFPTLIFFFFSFSLSEKINQIWSENRYFGTFKIWMSIYRSSINALWLGLSGL